MDIQTFNRKPDLLSVVRLTAENMAEVAQWCGGTVSSDGRFLFVFPPAGPRQAAELAPTQRAAVGDYVVLDDANRWHCVGHTALHNAYDRVP